MDLEGFRRVAKDAGLTKVELALIYGVSRQTLHYWLHEGPPRAGTYLWRMAKVITAALIIALDKGLLPLSGSLSKEKRAARVASIAKTSQSLKPAPQA